MIKKESRDILPQLAVFLLCLLAIPLLYIIPIQDQPNLMSLTLWVLGISLLLIANGFGMSMFNKERRDNAFEYLLSFPMSKSRILYNKLIPRLAMLAPLTIGFQLVVWVNIDKLNLSSGGLFTLIDPLFFPVWVVFLLISGMFLGLFEQKNLMALVTIAVMYGTVFICLGVRKVLYKALPGIAAPRYMNGLAFVLGCAIVLSILGIFFIQSYRQFDMKSMSKQASRYALKVIGPLVFFIIAGIVAMVIL